MSQEEIEKAIPHRGPMLLVDAIVEKGENKLVCTKTFHEDEFFFQGHYPEFKLVPGVILCEATMQVGAILVYTTLIEEVEPGYNKVPVATRINDAKFKKMVRPGDTIEMTVTLNERVSEAFFMTGIARVDGKVAVRFDFACTAADPQW